MPAMWHGLSVQSRDMKFSHDLFMRRYVRNRYQLPMTSTLLTTHTPMTNHDSS
jgi:hypothetical protein